MSLPLFFFFFFMGCDWTAAVGCLIDGITALLIKHWTNAGAVRAYEANYYSQKNDDLVFSFSFLMGMCYHSSCHW
jgi:hypothetical protein